MEIRVIHPGPYTTVQDAGRPGWRKVGLAPGGAADSFALRLANLLVGNPEDAAVLECTLAGPVLEFAEATTIAVAGGEFSSVPGGQPRLVEAGERIAFGPLRQGCRGYIAVAGGIDVAEALGSRSTDVRIGVGGWEGRPLRKGDRLPAQAWQPARPPAHWRISPEIMPGYSSAPTLRVLPGSHRKGFGRRWLEESFTVTPDSDRMGLRLRGPALIRRPRGELASGPVVPGTIQVPPDGQPILLLVDAQTIGGYARLAHVIEVDLPIAAQLRPGDSVRFRTVTLDEAHALRQAREAMLAKVAQGLATKLGAS